MDFFRKPTRTIASHRTRYLPRHATLFSLSGTGTREIVSLRARRRKEINTYTLLKKKICPFKMNQIFFRKPTRTIASHRTRYLPRHATLFSLSGTGTREIVSLRARRRKEINTYTLLKKKICPFKMNQIFYRHATLFSLSGTGTREIVSLRARRRKEINTYTLLKKKICPFKMNQIFYTNKL